MNLVLPLDTIAGAAQVVMGFFAALTACFVCMFAARG